MMLASKSLAACFSWIAVVLLCGTNPALGADLRVLPGHLPKTISGLEPKGRMPATNQLWLAIELPLRDRPGLEGFVAQVSDPASPNFRQFLTPEELTARFGPTEQDYEAMTRFATANGLAIAATHPNRLVLDVTGPVAAIENAFHIVLRTYRHPTEARDFFAPDTEPAVEAALPVAHIGGLNNYSRPHSRRANRHVKDGTPRNGSSPDGTGAIFGDDFRKAYVPGSALTGAGQSVGLFEWDGSYPNAVAAYAKAAGGGRTNIAIRYVLIDGFNGIVQDQGSEGEVDMDIELAMAMAPGLSGIVVFEGNPNVNSPIDILNAMAASNTVKNLSCSWAWSAADEPYANTDAVFLEMAAQGQSFFDASGDSDAFTIGASSVNGVDNPATYNAPSSSPYITQCGGTVMTMNGTGASYASEKVWNDGLLGGYYWGSSGGISSYYSIPGWQTTISMTASKGSPTQRNIPDVAADAENIYEILGQSATGDDYGGGTSSAAPLWAAFMALVNQQLASNRQPSAGFINPAIYAIAARSNYASCFHDITSGNNEWSASPSQYSAVAGYDLCTGLGTMNGTNLINALAGLLPTPSFLSLARGAGRFNLTWAAVAGRPYQVQYIANLSATNWNNLGSATNASGSVATVSDAFTNSQRFYRVFLVQ